MYDESMQESCLNQLHQYSCITFESCSFYLRMFSKQSFFFIFSTPLHELLFCDLTYQYACSSYLSYALVDFSETFALCIYKFSSFQAKITTQTHLATLEYNIQNYFSQLHQVLWLQQQQTSPDKLYISHSYVYLLFILVQLRPKSIEPHHSNAAQYKDESLYDSMPRCIIIECSHQSPLYVAINHLSNVTTACRAKVIT